LINLKNKKTIVGTILTLALVACGGFVYTTVGGNVKGLTTASLSTITMGNEANFTSTLNADGPFSFKVASNGSYNIRVVRQPNPVNCTVVNGVGKMTSETPVNNIAVTCVPNVPVKGVLHNLVVGTTIGLSRNSATDVEFTRTQAAEPAVQVPPLPAVDNSFTLPYYVVSGQSYDVSVTSQPAAQVCSVLNGKGTADNTNLASATNVAVYCVPGVPVGVTLAGLKTGLFISLSNNANDPLNMFANGALTFNKSLLNGGAYAVTIVTQPVGQTCTVTNGTGTAVLGTPVTAINVAINCV
jgi:hypothetical protein